MTPENHFIIAIDGPAGCGKSTLAKGLARELGLTYLDTGATYRAIALRALENIIDPYDLEATTKLAHDVVIDFIPDDFGESEGRVMLDGVDVTDLIRTSEVSEAASVISKNPNVRHALVRVQRVISDRLFASGARGIAVEGRDIGTVVFPDAKVKIFLTASLDERTKRRMTDSGEDPNIYRHFQDMKATILARDISDQTREASPLKPARDAILIDNTSWSPQETLQHVLGIVRNAMG